MTSSNDYIHELLTLLYQHCEKQPPFNTDAASETDTLFINTLKEITERNSPDESTYHQGQQLIGQIVACYPHITPQINRDLLWLLGGDCLHYMTDEEIAYYQRVEELMFSADNGHQPKSFLQAKSKLARDY